MTRKVFAYPEDDILITQVDCFLSFVPQFLLIFSGICKVALSSISLSLLLIFLGTGNTVSANSSSISLAIDSNMISLDILPTVNGIFRESVPSTISISTNNSTGYTLRIRAGGLSNPTSLVNNTDSGIFISSISSALSQSTFSSDEAYNNQWGYRPSRFNSVANSDYLPSPSVQGDTLDITNAANSITNEYTISLGTRVNNALPPGSYSNTFIIEAVANSIPYTITYNANAGAELVSNMPANVSSSTYDDIIPIDPIVPIRDGYRFKGWCTLQTVDESACTGTTYNPDGGGTATTWTIDQTISNNSLNVYAMWETVTFEKAFAYAGKSKYNNYYRMQDITSDICATVKKEQVGLLIDSRDNEVYYIGKLNDERCWMLDNLRLGGSSPIPLTTSNTNITTNWTLPIQNTTLFINSYTKPLIDTDVKNSTTTKYGQGSNKRGVYYNYCAATAETYCHPYGAGVDVPNTIVDAPYDICPSGWRLPTGTPTGDYGLLLNAYDNNYLDSITALGQVLSGYKQSTPNDDMLGQEAYIWTSTYCDASGACVLSANSSRYKTDVGIGRGDAVLPVRCINKQSI